MRVLIVHNNEAQSSNLIASLLTSVDIRSELIPFHGTSLNVIKSKGTPFEIPLIIFIPGNDAYKSQGELARELSINGYSVATSMSGNYPNSNNSLNVELGMLKPGRSDTMEHNHLNVSFMTTLNTVLHNSEATLENTLVTVKDLSNPWNNYIVSDDASPYYIPLATLSYDNFKYCFGYIPKGTQTDTYITGAPVFHLGWVFVGLLDKAALVLKDVFEYCLLNTKPPFILKGQVTDSSNRPLSRKIYIYNQRTGALQGFVESDISGFYSFKVLRDDPLFLVCLPDDSTKNGQVHTNIIPTTVESTTDVNE